MPSFHVFMNSYPQSKAPVSSPQDLKSLWIICVYLPGTEMQHADELDLESSVKQQAYRAAFYAYIRESSSCGYDAHGSQEVKSGRIVWLSLHDVPRHRVRQKACTISTFKGEGERHSLERF